MKKRSNKKPKLNRRESLEWIAVDRLVTLSRNPQYLTPKQLDSLKRSIERDGFLVPILVRAQTKSRYEVVSGNHRFLAAKELGLTHVPCVIVPLTESAAKRVAVNLNTIHGEPTAELMAPFLADLDDATLGDIHLEKSLLDDVLRFDSELKERLEKLEAPSNVDRGSPTTPIAHCKCPKCGRSHVRGPGRKAD